MAAENKHAHDSPLRYPPNDAESLETALKWLANFCNRTMAITYCPYSECPINKNCQEVKAKDWRRFVARRIKR